MVIAPPVGWKPSLTGLYCMVGLAQLVRSLVLELIYIGLNLRFNMSVIFMTNYFFTEI
jgi:hypothetical protein